MRYCVRETRNRRKKAKSENITTNRKNVFSSVLQKPEHSFQFRVSVSSQYCQNIGSEFRFQASQYSFQAAATKRPSLVKNRNKKLKKKSENITTNQKNVFSFQFRFCRSQNTVFGSEFRFQASQYWLRPSDQVLWDHTVTEPLCQCSPTCASTQDILVVWHLAASCKSIPISRVNAT
jgi:hypothetical protein